MVKELYTYDEILDAVEKHNRLFKNDLKLSRKGDKLIITSHKSWARMLIAWLQYKTTLRMV